MSAPTQSAECRACSRSHHRRPRGGSQDAFNSTGEQIKNRVRRMDAMKDGITGWDVEEESWELSGGAQL